MGAVRYSLSPTVLDSFRRFREGLMTADLLRRRLLEPYYETPKMAAGKAIHESLERQAVPGELCYGGYAVTIAGADTPLPGGRKIVAREAWLRHELEVDVHDAIVETNARLDGRLDPPAVLDYKTSEGKSAPWRWLERDCQWRLYCLFAGVDLFVCRHFRFRVERPIAADATPHVFTDAPVDRVFENDWTMDDVSELCAVAIGTAKTLDLEDAIRSKTAGTRQLRYFGRLVAQNPRRAERRLGRAAPSSAELRELTVFQVGRLIDRLKGE